MKIKTYEAKTTREAMTKIKQDLGPDALILNTREIIKRKWFGFRKEKFVEVVAGIANRKPAISKPSPARSGPGDLAPMGTPPQHPGESPKGTSSEPLYTPSREDEETSRARNIRHALDGLHKQMAEVGLERELIRRIVNMFDDMITDAISSGRKLHLDTARQEFIEQLARLIPIAGGIDFDHFESQKIIALVGPTGVGKTTTIAKLAAIASVLKDKKVALLSIDAYRISAFEQLKTYADIIGLPVKLALNPQETVEAIENYSDQELILVDTVGRSPRHKIDMTELHSYIKAINPTELYLTLSASVKNADATKIIKRYEEMAIDKMIFTKLDETYSLDSLINSAYRTKYPLSYFCTGQSVPDDIEVANIDRIAKFLVSDEQLEGVINILREE